MSKSVNELFLPCAMRTQLTAFAKDGTKRKVQRCGEPTADHNTKDVTPEVCESCPVRAEVTLKAMELNRYKPPLLDETHTVVSKRKFTEAVLPWLPCQDRELAQVQACCGQNLDLPICGSVDCFRLGSSIHPGHCQECANRKP